MCFQFKELGLVAAALLVLITLPSCFKEEFITDGDAQLEFSLDTLRFDTVFTELGSSTRSFRVFNTHDLPIIINSIELPNGNASFFRMNADGIAGSLVEEIEIPENDSIWIFVEVTVDPDQSVSESPFVISEKMVFLTNGNFQEIHLEAWGQNANYIPNRFHQNKVSVLSCALQSVAWDDPKPYVVYGTLLIDSCTLRIPPGARIHVHGGIANNTLGIFNDGVLFTLPDGKLEILGTAENPVLIQDDRLEEDYTGLWGGIRLGPGSGPHRISHATIRHATSGVALDSAVTLEIDNSTLHSNSGFGIFARHGNVQATNCLIYDNGAGGIALTYGGEYTFDYCTSASFGDENEALLMNNFFCPDQLCLEGVRLNPLQAVFSNCILVGSGRDEILFSDASPDGQDDLFNYEMRNCIVRIDELLEPEQFPDFFMNCENCQEWGPGDTLFVDAGLMDFHLDTLSVAEGMAVPIPGIEFDLEGNMRDQETPDIGCFEYVPR